MVHNALLAFFWLQAKGGMELKTLLLGEEKWGFLLETALRTCVMFTVILLSLRLLGKRGLKQLSVFELGVIIGLGSAAGDPMFYKDVGLLPGIIVFVIVICLYRFITFLINRSNRFERFVEGSPTTVLSKGRIVVENFKQEPIALDEFFSELRLKSVSHLGQVAHAILETNGELSVYFLPDEEVHFGLPIVPGLCEDKRLQISEAGHYACSHCGYTVYLQPAATQTCSCCHKKTWIKAIDAKRVH